MEEIWKAVPSLPGWEASSLGRVRITPYRSPKRGNRLYGGSPRAGTRSGAKLKISHHGKTLAVHRLVCEAFNGPPPADKPLCMHLDENLYNNRPENLAWGTQTENMRAPKLRASWTPEKIAEARRKAVIRRRENIANQRTA